MYQKEENFIKPCDEPLECLKYSSLCTELTAGLKSVKFEKKGIKFVKCVIARNYSWKLKFACVINNTCHFLS